MSELYSAAQPAADVMFPPAYCGAYVVCGHAMPGRGQYRELTSFAASAAGTTQKVARKPLRDVRFGGGGQLVGPTRGCQHSDGAASIVLHVPPPSLPSVCLH
jgi:hypothetical protein